MTGLIANNSYTTNCKQLCMGYLPDEMHPPSLSSSDSTIPSSESTILLVLQSRNALYRRLRFRSPLKLPHAFSFVFVKVFLLLLGCVHSSILWVQVVCKQICDFRTSLEVSIQCKIRLLLGQCWCKYIDL